MESSHPQPSPPLGPHPLSTSFVAFLVDAVAHLQETSSTGFHTPPLPAQSPVLEFGHLSPNPNSYPAAAHTVAARSAPPTPSAGWHRFNPVALQLNAGLMSTPLYVRESPGSQSTPSYAPAKLSPHSDSLQHQYQYTAPPPPPSPPTALWAPLPVPPAMFSSVASVNPYLPFTYQDYVPTGIPLPAAPAPAPFPTLSPLALNGHLPQHASRLVHQQVYSPQSFTQQPISLHHTPPPESDFTLNAMSPGMSSSGDFSRGASLPSCGSDTSTPAHVLTPPYQPFPVTPPNQPTPLTYHMFEMSPPGESSVAAAASRLWGAALAARGYGHPSDNGRPSSSSSVNSLSTVSSDHLYPLEGRLEGGPQLKGPGAFPLLGNRSLSIESDRRSSPDVSAWSASAPPRFPRSAAREASASMAQERFPHSVSPSTATPAVVPVQDPSVSQGKSIFQLVLFSHFY
jgi:hypothetical protein